MNVDGPRFVATPRRKEVSMKVRAIVIAAATAALCAVPAFAEGGKQAPQKIDVHQTLDLPAAQGCRYIATVNGTVKAQSDGEKFFDPNLDVTATVSCPNKIVMKTTENVMSVGPLTRGELEERLERRGIVYANGGRCLYEPDFSIKDKKISAVGVGYLCAL
jgi:hypothetical protein